MCRKKSNLSGNLLGESIWTGAVMGWRDWTGILQDITLDSANAFSDALLKKTLSSATAVRELDAKITEFKRQIDKLTSTKSGTADTRAVVTIVAGEAGPAQLRLTYREPPAW